jgi:uncharacterized protein YbjT (DUF2867 family)
MRVLVCGATGCIGSAVSRALRSRGHEVVAASRRSGWALDFMQPTAPAVWAQHLRAARIDAVVNCVGILMQREGQRFERVHTQGPLELFAGAALAGIGRVVQISALGAATGTSAYLASKRAADQGLLALPLAGAVLRPALVYGPGNTSSRLFATLAALPVVSLPGGGAQRLQPIHVYEVAEIVARCLERREPVRGIHDIAGNDVLSCREMLACYRRAMGLADPLWLMLPMPLMRAGAWAAEALPQNVFCRETVALLAQGLLPAHNAAAELLGRAPSGMATGLRISPPQPLVDLRATLSPALALVLRATLAFMWLWTAAVSLALPHTSGVWQLLARCGFEGDAARAVWLASCALNTVIGLALLRRPAPGVHALQMAAIVGYTLTAAWNMPELTLDHCAPLAKNLPLLAAAGVLWLAQGSATGAATVGPTPRRGAASQPADRRPA